MSDDWRGAATEAADARLKREHAAMLAFLESIRDGVYLPGSTLDELDAMIAEVKGGTL